MNKNKATSKLKIAEILNNEMSKASKHQAPKYANRIVVNFVKTSFENGDVIKSIQNL